MNTILKILGKIYQWTGYYCFIAEWAEDRYIGKEIINIYNDYVDYLFEEQELEEVIPFESYISIQRGSWQCKYGFYRAWRKMKWE